MSAWLLGKRIRLVAMPHDPHPIKIGATGTVKWVNKLADFTQIAIDWTTGGR